MSRIYIKTRTEKAKNQKSTIKKLRNKGYVIYDLYPVEGICIMTHRKFAGAVRSIFPDGSVSPGLVII